MEFPDDSVGGGRLHVLGTPGEIFTLKAIPVTGRCWRGVTAERRSV